MLLAARAARCRIHLRLGPMITTRYQNYSRLRSEEERDRYSTEKKSRIWNQFVSRVVTSDPEISSSLKPIPLHERRDDLEKHHTENFMRLLLENRRTQTMLEQFRQRKFQQRNMEAHIQQNRLTQAKGDKKTRKGASRASGILGTDSTGKEASKRLRPSNESMDSASQRKTVVLRARQSVKYLSSTLSIPANEIIWVAQQIQDKTIGSNDFLSREVAELVVSEFGYSVASVTSKTLAPTSQSKQKSRPPVVCIMGHVDHGKTTLLDALRNTSIAQNESGGITQSIGAFHVQDRGDDSFRATFLDTPGHSLFSKMRSVGASSLMTDIVILVVDSVVGLMPQSLEAISLAQKAKVPIIVALNKCDKEGSNPMQVIEELKKNGVETEDIGGDVLCVQISAKEKAGLDNLREAILLSAEINELRCSYDSFAKAAVVESRLLQGLGVIVNCVVREGTLRVGDWVICGKQYCKVRVLKSAEGHNLNEALPSIPVSLSGFKTLAGLGSSLQAVSSEEEAREIVAQVQEEEEAELMEDVEAQGEAMREEPRGVIVGKGRNKRTVVAWNTEEDRQAEKDADARTVQLYLKADVIGSLDALQTYVAQLPQDVLKIEVIKSGIGDFTPSDIELASSTGCLLAGFNLQPSEAVQNIAKTKCVRLHFRDVIYHLMDDIRDYLTLHMPEEETIQILGAARVQQVFPLSGRGGRQPNAAGCVVTSGALLGAARYRVLREKQVIHQGAIETLKHFKESVSKIEKGKECGIVFSDFNDFQGGDDIECIDVQLKRLVFDDTLARGSKLDVQKKY